MCWLAVDPTLRSIPHLRALVEMPRISVPSGTSGARNNLSDKKKELLIYESDLPGATQDFHGRTRITEHLVD